MRVYVRFYENFCNIEPRTVSHIKADRPPKKSSKVQ